MSTRPQIIISVTVILLFTGISGHLSPIPAETKELRLAHFMPPVHTLHEKVFLPLAQQLEQFSQGDLTIRIYPAGSLGKGPVQQYKRAVEGVADITFCLQNYTAALFPRSLLVTRPGIAASAEDGTRKFWEIYDTYLSIEYEEIKLLGAWVMSPTVLMTRTKAVRTMSDMTGMKVRISSPLESELIQAWGGVPVAMPITESYSALNTGVVDAVFIQPSALYRPWNLSEQARFVTDNLPSPTSVVFLAMNRNSWNALTPSQQTVLERLTGRDFSVNAARIWSEQDRQSLARAQNRDDSTTYIRISPAARRTFADAARKTSEETLSRLEEIGINGRPIYDALSR
jgi:TRAP-type C4-dicarboxylate transport system substrate-binding protein